MAHTPPTREALVDRIESELANWHFHGETTDFAGIADRIDDITAEFWAERATDCDDVIGAIRSLIRAIFGYQRR